jgi:signal peptidase II
MLFFPLFDYTWPDWFPIIGGEYFLFFSPVFNIADSSIFLGVVVILIFQRRFFGERVHHREEGIDGSEDQTNPPLEATAEQPALEKPDNTESAT